MKKTILYHIWCVGDNTPEESSDGHDFPLTSSKVYAERLPYIGRLLSDYPSCSSGLLESYYVIYGTCLFAAAKLKDSLQR